MTGMVFHIQRFSLQDGPGIRTTVFLKGCPLRCQWCHNPESFLPGTQLLLREERCVSCGDCEGLCRNSAIYRANGRYSTLRGSCLVCGTCANACPAEARELVGVEMATTEVLLEIEKDRVFFEQSGGGVTFSGGEPLLQHEFLLSLLKDCRGKGIHTVVDTSGYASPAVLRGLSPFVDLFLYDLKILDEERHVAFTGVSNRIILENLRRLLAWKNRVILRVPLIPGVNDDRENIQRTGELARDLGSIDGIQLLPYHRTGSEKRARLGMEGSPDTAPPSFDRVQVILEELKTYVDVVTSEG